MTTPNTVRPADLITPGETARELRIDKATLSRWVVSGRLVPVVIAGVRFFRRADVAAIVAERPA